MAHEFRNVPEGLYDPVQDRMMVDLGSEHSSPQAVMASIHEANHAFLNASTTFGCAMILCAAVVPVVGRRMIEFLARLVRASRRTHETYASISGLASATNGLLNREVLREYPAYTQYLDDFVRTFEPFSLFSIVVLGSCARAAMQTSIYQGLLDLPCEMWPEMELSGLDVPDIRFELLMTSQIVSSADAAVRLSWMRSAPDPSGDNTPPGLLNAAAALEGQQPARLELIYRSSFDVFAEEIRRCGEPRPNDEDQRKNLDRLISKVQEFLGPGRSLDFKLPSNVDQDMEAALINFRREVLILRQDKDPALLLNDITENENALDPFILIFEGRPYLQLVTMPADKASALYSVSCGSEVLAARRGLVITGMRRRVVTPAGTAQIEFLLLTKMQLDAISTSRKDLKILCNISAAALYDPMWREEWVSDGSGNINQSLSLVDIDPFALIDSRVASGGRIHYSFARMRWEEPGWPSEINIFCFMFENEPTALYFSPCSAPYRDAIAAFIRHRNYPVTFNNSFMNDWSS